MEELWDQVLYRSALWASVTDVFRDYSISSFMINQIPVVK